MEIISEFKRLYPDVEVDDSDIRDVDENFFKNLHDMPQAVCRKAFTSKDPIYECHHCMRESGGCYCETCFRLCIVLLSPRILYA